MFSEGLDRAVSVGGLQDGIALVGEGLSTSFLTSESSSMTRIVSWPPLTSWLDRGGVISHLDMGRYMSKVVSLSGLLVTVM